MIESPERVIAGHRLYRNNNATGMMDIWDDKTMSWKPTDLNSLPTELKNGVLHQHRTKDGLLVDCYHGSKALLTDWKFWCGLTAGFPLEHLLWTKVWPLSLVSVWFGL